MPSYTLNSNLKTISSLQYPLHMPTYSQINLFTFIASKIAVAITANAALDQRECLSVVAMMDGMVLIAHCHLRKIVRMERIMIKVNFHGIKISIWVCLFNVLFFLYRRPNRLWRPRMLLTSSMRNKSTLCLITEAHWYFVEKTTASNYGIVLWANEVSNWWG